MFRTRTSNAYQNKRVIYALLFKASKEATLTIAADPKHLGAKIGITSVLHTLLLTASPTGTRRRVEHVFDIMTHHPHIHMIVPGGGISPDGSKWVSCRPNFFLHVKVLSRLYRRRFLEMLVAAHQAGQLKFHGIHAGLADEQRFERFLKRLKKKDWVVYAKEPFGGPEAVLAYLSRYTHRVAISNHRLLKIDEKGVTFRYKDYRIEGPGRYKTMALTTHEFIRRFLMHVLPRRFHRIRHYGLLANGNRAANIAKARELLAVSAPTNKSDAEVGAEPDEPDMLAQPCPCCGGRLIIIETFERGSKPRTPTSPEGIDSS